MVGTSNSVVVHALVLEQPVGIPALGANNSVVVQALVPEQPVGIPALLVLLLHKLLVVRKLLVVLVHKLLARKLLECRLRVLHKVPVLHKLRDSRCCLFLVLSQAVPGRSQVASNLASLQHGR